MHREKPSPSIIQLGEVYSVEDTYEDEKKHCSVHAVGFIVTSLDRCVPLSLLAITVTTLNSKQQNKGDPGSDCVFLKKNKVEEMA